VLAEVSQKELKGSGKKKKKTIQISNGSLGTSARHLRKCSEKTKQDSKKWILQL
jgi:hypothetical protein